MKDVASGTAPETVKKALGLIHVKRGLGIGVKRTKGLVAVAHLAKLQMLP